MNTQKQNNFDVFLSHSHEDAEIVELIGERLEDQHDFRVWLDKWILVPGAHWQRDMARGLEQAKTCAVCIGKDTPSGWFREEIEKALNLQTRDSSFRVIPVVLPSGDSKMVGEFLELRTWVNFSNGIEDEWTFHTLASGIKGEAPGRKPKIAGANTPVIIDKEGLKVINELREQGQIDHEMCMYYQKTIIDDFHKTRKNHEA